MQVKQPEIAAASRIDVGKRWRAGFQRQDTLGKLIVVVQLIACANLAGLLLVRAIRRRREIAVRLALGAPAGVLLRQPILESLVLSVTGGALGLALAVMALRVGVSWLPETLHPYSRDRPRLARSVVRDRPRRADWLGLRTGSGFCLLTDKRK